jgi:hypothetical protein
MLSRLPLLPCKLVCRPSLLALTPIATGSSLKLNYRPWRRLTRTASSALPTENNAKRSVLNDLLDWTQTATVRLARPSAKRVVQLFRLAT